MKKRHFVAALALFGALGLVPTLIDAPEKARRASLAADLNTVRMGLEQYATDHGGRYPRAHEAAAALEAKNYLPGNRLPRNRYLPGDVPSRLVAEPLAGSGTAAAPAHAPGTYLYRLDPRTKVYVLDAVCVTRDGPRLLSSLTKP